MFIRKITRKTKYVNIYNITAFVGPNLCISKRKNLII